MRSLHGFAKAKVERSETVETAKNQTGILKIEQRNERECESEVNKYFLSQDENYN